MAKCKGFYSFVTVAQKLFPTKYITKYGSYILRML
jgi:hypothetical protein